MNSTQKKIITDFKCTSCDFKCKDKNTLSKHNTNIHEYEKYEKMNGQDQFEVQELICDKLCIACESWHR